MRWSRSLEVEPALAPFRAEEVVGQRFFGQGLDAHVFDLADRQAVETGRALWARATAGEEDRGAGAGGEQDRAP